MFTVFLEKYITSPENVCYVRMQTKPQKAEQKEIPVGANEVRAHERFPCRGRRSGH